MSDTAYYFAKNYDDWTLATPYAQQVYQLGFHDRDDRIVDWVIRYYTPGDGRKRFPLKIYREITQQPRIWLAGIVLVVDGATRSQLLNLGAAVEFSAVEFEKPFRLTNNDRLFELDDDDEIKVFLDKNGATVTDRPEARFELIAPLASARFNPPIKVPVKVSGKLTHCRTVDLDQSIDVTVDADILHRSKMLYYSGGLICLPDVADILHKAASPRMFTLAKLSFDRP